MSVDKAIRELVAAEVARAMVPVQQALAQLNANADVVSRLASALGQPVKRGPGRPPRLALPASTGATGKRRGRKPRVQGDQRECAIQGCGRPARSKGYCAAHYQKFRMLERTDRLPADWKADAPPNSVKNISLPRGRAGAKALAESKKK